MATVFHAICEISNLQQEIALIKRKQKRFGMDKSRARWLMIKKASSKPILSQGKNKTFKILKKNSKKYFLFSVIFTTKSSAGTFS